MNTIRTADQTSDLHDPKVDEKVVLSVPRNVEGLRARAIKYGEKPTIGSLQQQL